MPKLDLDAIPQTNATGYPAPFDAPVSGRRYRRLAPACWLDQAPGSSTTWLARRCSSPQAGASQRHWHTDLDELLVMLAGEAVLVEDDGETAVRPGDILAWPAGAANGHHLQNRGEEPCVFVVASAGDFAIDGGEYPDIDMRFSPEGYFRRDGSRYETERIP